MRGEEEEKEEESSEPGRSEPNWANGAAIVPPLSSVLKVQHVYSFSLHKKFTLSRTFMLVDLCGALWQGCRRGALMWSHKSWRRARPRLHTAAEAGD